MAAGASTDSDLSSSASSNNLASLSVPLIPDTLQAARAASNSVGAQPSNTPPRAFRVRPMTPYTPHGSPVLGIYAPEENSVVLQAPVAATISTMICQKLHIPVTYYEHLKVEPNTPAGTVFLRLNPGLDFPHHLLTVLSKSVAALNSPVRSLDTIRQPSACAAAVSKVLYPLWDRASGIAALAYGAGFGAMVFSITDSLPENTIARVFILTCLGILAFFSMFVNYLQSDSSLRTLGSDLHKRLSPHFGRTTPEGFKVLGTTLALAVLFYFFTVPAAVLNAETVRRGMITMKGADVSNDVNTVDNGIYEGYMNLIRAGFLTKTLITIGDTLGARTAIMNNQNFSANSRVFADWSLPISLSIGALYGFRTYVKTGDGIANSLLIARMYPAQLAIAALQRPGVVINAVVAAKLFLGGLLSSLQVLSKRYRSAVFFSVIACAAGVATGLATGVTSFSDASVWGDILLNLIYAISANLPYLMEATNASEISALLKNLDDLERIIGLIVLDDHPVKVQLEEAAKKLSEAIKNAKESGGFVRLAKRTVEPFTRLIYGSQESKVELPHAYAQLQRTRTFFTNSTTPDTTPPVADASTFTPQTAAPMRI